MTVTDASPEARVTGWCAVETSQRDWRGVFLAFRPAVRRVSPDVPSCSRACRYRSREPLERALRSFPERHAFSFADLAADENPLPVAWLSFLGAMTAGRRRSRERLFERALVTSWHFDTPGTETAFLRAYALLNLEHRPAALALINGAATPDAIALRALLNGDLPGAAEAAATSREPPEATDARLARR